MSDTEKSRSLEQVAAEKFIFQKLKDELGIELEANNKIPLLDNQYTYIQPDFFSEEHRIIGEIFAHIGKPKKAQNNKIANDILKMLTYEKIKSVKMRKMLVVCDEQEYETLKGSSVLAESIRQFEIEVMLVPISEDMRMRLEIAQRRQKMVNE